MRACTVERHTGISHKNFCASRRTQNERPTTGTLNEPRLYFYRKKPSVWTHCLGNLMISNGIWWTQWIHGVSQDLWMDKLPVVPARGGAEVTLGLHAPCASQARACALCANLLHCCCPRTCPARDPGATQRQANTFFTHGTALFTPCTLHTPHFTLHTCTSHSTLHLISNHVSSSHLISPHPISSHMSSK